MARVLVLGGFAPSLVNFRGPLLRAMAGHGHEVWAAAPEPDPAVEAALAAIGVRYRSFPLARAGINPIADLQTRGALGALVREVAPDAVLAYTAKPVVHGLDAARRAGVRRRFALITGLGFAFIGSGLGARAVGWLLARLYRRALAGAEVVFFQNPDDRALFIERGILAAGAPSLVVPGSGVDLERFSPVPPPEGPPVFLLIARLLFDKGIGEFVAAAREVRGRLPGARFVVVGPRDPNPAAIGEAELSAWRSEGVVELAGEVEDVRPTLAAASVYVLPSYREGMPRTVLEAMAMARPVITTDVPGCRETVVAGENGILVPARDPAALAAAMLRLGSDAALRARMGARGRSIAEARFDARLVTATMLDAMGL